MLPESPPSALRLIASYAAFVALFTSAEAWASPLVGPVAGQARALFGPWVYATTIGTVVTVLITVGAAWVTPRWDIREAGWTCAGGAMAGIAIVVVAFSALGPFEGMQESFRGGFPFILLGAIGPLTFAAMLGAYLHFWRTDEAAAP